MSPRSKRNWFSVFRWGVCFIALVALLACCWAWMGKTVPSGITVASICAVSCFYMVVLLLSALCFFGCHRAFRNPLVKCGAFALLFLWGCVAYFFHPVDRHRVRDVTMEERIRVRSIESPNRVVAAFFPSRGGFELIGESSSAVHYFAFHTVVVFFITCLMFSFFGRGIVNKALAIFARRRLDVFWGVSEQALLLAESIMKETHDHEVLFRLPMSLRGDRDKLLEVTHSIEDIGCLWELSDFRIDNKNGFAKWCLLIGSRHFFMLGSGHENVAQASRLTSVLPEKDDDKEEDCVKVFYVRVESSLDQRVYLNWCETVGKKVEPIVVNEAILTATDFIERFSRLQHPGTVIENAVVKNEYSVAIIGFGKTGQAVFDVIACNGQFPMKHGSDATGLSVSIYDHNRDVLDSYAANHAGISGEFKVEYKNVDSKNLPVEEMVALFDQVVLCLPNDEDNIVVAERFKKEIDRVLAKNVQLVARIKDSDRNRYWGTNIHRFGELRKLYVWDKWNASPIDAMSMELHAWWAKADNPRKAWKSATHSNRMSTRASARCEINMLRLLGYDIAPIADMIPDRVDEKEVQKAIERHIDHLARVEHLRWNAYHVMRGYLPWDLKDPDIMSLEAKDREAKQLARFGKHADIVPFDALPEVDYKIACAVDERNRTVPLDAFVGDKTVDLYNWEGIQKNKDCTQRKDYPFCRQIVHNVIEHGKMQIVKFRKELANGSNV